VSYASAVFGFAVASVCVSLCLLHAFMVTKLNDRHVTAAPSLAVVRQRLKTFLFTRSYSDIVI